METNSAFSRRPSSDRAVHFASQNIPHCCCSKISWFYRFLVLPVQSCCIARRWKTYLTGTGDTVAGRILECLPRCVTVVLERALAHPCDRTAFWRHGCHVSVTTHIVRTTRTAIGRSSRQRIITRKWRTFELPAIELTILEHTQISQLEHCRRIV